jgi:anion-transporting  ArsA/GET3 family ATPase
VDPREFLSQSRVVIVAGKGGVGKTTVSAALARMAAAEGLKVLIVAVEAKSGLVAALGATGFLEYGERELAPNIRARTLTPDIALVEYMESHGLGKLSKKMANSGMVEVVATAAPGIKDILVLGKIKQLERSGVYDLIIVDAPAAGHALTFLVSPRSVMDVARSGILRAQADDAFQLLTDSSRCQVVLVTLPEETPVNELIETEAALRSKIRVKLAPVVVNGVYPTLDGLDVDPEKAAADQGITLFPGEADVLRTAAEFRRRRAQLQQEQLRRLEEGLDLPQVHLPAVFAVDFGLAEIDVLAAAWADQLGGVPEVGRVATGKTVGPNVAGGASGGGGGKVARSAGK